MKITICGSLKFSHEMQKVAEELKTKGYEIELPITTQLIMKGECSVEEIEKEKNTKEFAERIKRFDAIRYYHNKIKESDAILVMNLDKNGIQNYIGGATFLEMGFAHVLGKKIFLYKDIPEVSYSDEIKGMEPMSLKEEIEKIKEFIPL